MDEKKQLLRELLIVTVGELLCTALMFLVYYFLHRLDWTVVFAAAIGVVLVILNLFVMILGVVSASKKAEQGDVVGGKRTMNLSMLIRFVLRAGILAAVVLGGDFHLPAIIAMLIPLVLFRPIISLGEFFRKSGEKTE